VTDIKPTLGPQHIRINSHTLHAVREILEAALAHSPEMLYGFDESEITKEDRDVWEAARDFLNLELPHHVVTWNLVSQQKANATDSLGSQIPDAHI
jgi:hypothetical protein